MKEKKDRKRLGTRAANVVLSLCEVAVGILLLIRPEEFTYGIVTALGILLCVLGAISIVKYFREEPVKAALERNLAVGLLEVALGVLFFLKKRWLTQVFPLLTVLYGLLMLVVGTVKIQWTADMLRAHLKKWYWPAISAALTLAFACIVLWNPFASTAVLWTFTAIFLIVEAVIDLLAALFAREGSE
ncbi:MAG: HdeD family acid-resistance protein [Aristaeellaceae bacterium]